MDGVLADVENSYRQCIIQTAKKYGAEVKAEDIERVSKKGKDTGGGAVITVPDEDKSAPKGILKDMAQLLLSTKRGLCHMEGALCK